MFEEFIYGTTGNSTPAQKAGMIVGKLTRVLGFVGVLVSALLYWL